MNNQANCRNDQVAESTSRPVGVLLVGSIICDDGSKSMFPFSAALLPTKGFLSFW